MDQLKVVSINGQLVTDSREVARMVEKRHDHLLADIRKYVEILQSQDYGSEKFFIESTYLNSRNQIQPCHLLTRLGCDMVANKMTGEKGVLFTAAYVTRFEDMEKALNSPKVLSPKEQLRASMQLTLETAQEVEEIKGKVEQLEDKVDNQMTLDYGMQRRLQRAVGERVYKLSDVRRKDLQSAVSYVEAWIPRRAA